MSDDDEEPDYEDDDIPEESDDIGTNPFRALGSPSESQTGSEGRSVHMAREDTASSMTMQQGSSGGPAASTRSSPLQPRSPQDQPTEEDILDLVEELKRGFYPEELVCLKVRVAKWDAASQKRLFDLVKDLPTADTILPSLGLPESLREQPPASAEEEQHQEAGPPDVRQLPRGGWAAIQARFAPAGLPSHAAEDVASPGGASPEEEAGAAEGAEGAAAPEPAASEGGGEGGRPQAGPPDVRQLPRGSWAAIHARFAPSGLPSHAAEDTGSIAGAAGGEASPLRVQGAEASGGGSPGGASPGGAAGDRLQPRQGPAVERSPSSGSGSPSSKTPKRFPTPEEHKTRARLGTPEEHRRMRELAAARGSVFLEPPPNTPNREKPAFGDLPLPPARNSIANSESSAGLEGWDSEALDSFDCASQEEPMGGLLTTVEEAEADQGTAVDEADEDQDAAEAPIDLDAPLEAASSSAPSAADAASGAPGDAPEAAEESLEPKAPAISVDEVMAGFPRAELQRRLAAFEGQEDHDVVKQRIHEKAARVKARAETAEVEQFLGMLRVKGGGNITLAWRRHFDKDGDGELSFGEFCAALTDLKYVGDTINLWLRLLARKSEGDHNKDSIRLDVVDPRGAAVLDTFASWCKREFGGPIEFFRDIDEDGSDSLTVDEFLEGLSDKGFFDNPETLPEDIRTPQLAMNNLYPLLDQGGGGCVTAEEVLFLEPDRPKRNRLQAELHNIREKGTGDINLEPLTSHAEDLLKDVYKRATPAGGKHWSQVQANDLFSSPSKPRRKPAAMGSTTPSRGLQRAASAPLKPAPRRPQPAASETAPASVLAAVAADLAPAATPPGSPARATASEVTARPSLRYGQAPSRTASVRLLRSLPPLKPKPSPHVLEHYTGWGHGGGRITYKKAEATGRAAEAQPSPMAAQSSGGSGARGGTGRKERSLRAQCYRQSLVPALRLPHVAPGSTPSSLGGLGQSASAGALPRARARESRAVDMPKFQPDNFGHYVTTGKQSDLVRYYMAM